MADNPSSLIHRITERLYRPVDISSSIFFRFAFGAIIVWEVYRYYSYGWIYRYYIEPDFFFSFHGFEWVTPWPGIGMYMHFYLLAAAAGMIAIGFMYRVGAVLLFLSFTYVFLLDEANYLNHFYLVCLYGFILIFLPLNRWFSIDAIRKPEIRSATTPTWVLWLLRFQMGVVYVYGGIAKMNYDWVIRLEPMRDWLSRRTEFPFIGVFFREEWMVAFMSMSGLLIDLLGPFLLLWRRTRYFMFALFVAFHLTNRELFHIGIFPWMAIAATTVFLEPEWPRKLWGFVTHQVRSAFKIPEPAAPAANRDEAAVSAEATGTVIPKHARLTVTLLALYAAFHILMPLRHWLYPGYVSWTEEGHNFSWHMKLRDKNATATITLIDPATGEIWDIEPREFLTPRQARKMENRPRMLQKFAHHLREEWANDGYENVEVYVSSMVILNGRPDAEMIDTERDLAAEPLSLWHADWITEFKK